ATRSGQCPSRTSTIQLSACATTAQVLVYGTRVTEEIPLTDSRPGSTVSTVSGMDTLEQIIGDAGGQLWTWVVLPVVVGLGLYFTIRSGVVQFRMIPEMFRTLTNKTPTDAAGKAQSISAFQAFTVSAASRVGVGNIAGVGTAIAVGGPGAVFWM